MMEFHVSRAARDRYDFSDTIFSYSGNVIFGGLSASRHFAHRMNHVRGAENDPTRSVQPGALHAMALIDEMSHALVDFYRIEVDPAIRDQALRWFEARLGKAALDKALLEFVEQFPTTGVYRGEQTGAEWLAGETEGVSHRAVAFEETMLLWLANANPAFAAFSELFNDEELSRTTAYREIAGQLREFFSTRPPVGPEKLNLVDMLRAPALASPHSLSDQLAFIRQKWAVVLGDSLERLLTIIDVLKEEDVAIWMRFHPPSAAAIERREKFPGGFQSGYAEVPSFEEAGQEVERFSPDQDWMPTTVLIAKSTYVWLEQLSRQYGWHIHRLDQIPDETLALLARQGINSLWLIGVWERSRASQTIKQLCGNPDAVASAYSLYSYNIAADLGGEAAYSNLRDRARAHGIRLASDMVPNHMGIDSSWVIEHPEWFMSRSDSPYPAYSFEGPDLSHDERVEIKIEDHYYQQTDAAVVFRRRDKWTGSVLYVYHGNDGTSFPWNDTAQLDYLNPATREQVIQTILQVARLFPIIRFDAAMTLAKRHFQRLWFPIPGTGGAIPSRAEYGMTKAQFDAAMPEEFWREVVDRVAREVPGTLLLAEAFWLMESYFVRTLGMHRVYNSAFMVMLRDEDNAKYRSVIKNTLEFDPAILKRYVNFMSNPDERTAVDQFGKEDKYFGVATLMATLPGLPMFGHGQIEGFTEKYGMEFRWPRYREDPDPWLVQRHERQIAPLLHRRWLFAESDQFLLFDLYREDGSVDENVFAYSNRRGDQRALIVYHNLYADTQGTLHHSASYAGGGQLHRRSIGQAFSLPDDANLILAYRDAVTGLEHLQRSARIVSQGISIALQAYECHVFLDWRELRPDDDHRWDLLCDSLNGSGVSSLDDALIQLELAPAHDSLRALLAADLVQPFAGLASKAGGRQTSTKEPAPESAPESASSLASAEYLRRLDKFSSRFFEEGHTAYGKRVGRRARLQADPEVLSIALSRLIRAALRLPSLEIQLSPVRPKAARMVLPSAHPEATATAIWGQALAWCVLEVLAESIAQEELSAGALELFDQLRLREPLAGAFARLGMSGEDGWRAAARLRVVFLARSVQAENPEKDLIAGLPQAIWQDADARWLMDVHEAESEWYFNKELHEELLWWTQMPSLMEIAVQPEPAAGAPARTKRVSSASSAGNTSLLRLQAVQSMVQEGLAEAKMAGYRMSKLLSAKPHTPVK